MGRALSKKLNLTFLDLDHYIEDKEGRSISDIFAEKGEVYFRKKETYYLKEVLDKDTSYILSVGGGTPCFGSNMELINKATLNSIYIKTDLPELSNRLLLEKENRPLIAHLPEAEFKDFIAKHLFERSFFYHQAHQTINNQGKSVDQVVEEIGKILV